MGSHHSGIYALHAARDRKILGTALRLTRLQDTLDHKATTSSTCPQLPRDGDIQRTGLESRVRSERAGLAVGDPV